MASLIRRTIAALFAGLLWPISGGAVGGGLQVAGAPGELSDREAAVHVLTRLGYGARPGDVDRVLKTGIPHISKDRSIPRLSQRTPTWRADWPG